MTFIPLIESAVSEVPELVGVALKAMGDEIAKLGTMLEGLAARMDKLDQKP
jgi:hypothetical protein